DDLLARLEAFFDHPHRVDALTGPDIAERDFVVVADDGDTAQALQFLNCALRNEERAYLFLEEHARASIGTWTDDRLRIRKIDQQAQCSGGGVHLTLDGRDRALLGEDGAVGERQLDAAGFGSPAGAFRRALGHFEIVGLRDADTKHDRVELRHRSQQRALAPANQAPWLDL